MNANKLSDILISRRVASIEEALRTLNLRLITREWISNNEGDILGSILSSLSWSTVLESIRFLDLL